MSTTKQEQATVLAALRFWQRLGATHGEPERDVATEGGTLEALANSEIDGLCERINALTEQRTATAEELDKAREIFSNGDVSIDAHALVSEADDAVWVQAWVRVELVGA